MKETNEFKLSNKLVKEHIKLYRTLNIVIYLIFLPIVLLFTILELFGTIGERIESILIHIRYKIIIFIFKTLYNKKGGK